MNKKSLILLPALGLILGGVVACTPKKPDPIVDPEVRVESVELNKTTMELEVGASDNLQATVKPMNATNTKVNWSSDKEAIATVSSIGKVTAVAEGTAVITATTADGGKTAICTVTVKAAGSKYGSLENPLTVEQALAIAAAECPNKDDTTAEPIYVRGLVTKVPTLKTNSETGATFAQNVYLADAAGGDELWVYSADYVGGAKAPYQNDTAIVSGYIKNYNGTIEMTAANSVATVIQSVTRGTSAITYVETDAHVVGTKVESATNLTEVTIEVAPAEGKEISSVSANGEELTADDAGKYTFAVKGDTTVTVLGAEPGVKIEKATMAYTGSTTNMTETGNAASVGLDPTLFTVDAALNNGSPLPGLNGAGNIRLYSDKTEAGKGNSITVSSARATIKSIQVELASSTAATIDDLKVSNSSAACAKEEGQIYTIEDSTFTLLNGAVSKDSKQLHISKVVISYVVKETVEATAVSLNKTTLELVEGKEETLTPSLLPATANVPVIFASSAADIATVNAGGKVSAIKAGTATITAFADNNLNGTYDEGEPKQACAVTVTAGAVTTEVTAPEADKTYKLGMKVDTKYWYATSEVDSYGAPTTSDDTTKAVDVKTEAGTKTGTLKIKIGEKYLNAKRNGKYVNLYVEDTCTTDFMTSYTQGEVTVNGLFVNADDLVDAKTDSTASGIFYLGNYGTNTKLNTSAISYLIKDGAVVTTQWRAVFCTIA